MNPRYAAVAQRAAHRCEYCQAPEAIFNFSFEVEHIVPPGLGGTDDESNLALSSRGCNLFKSSQIGPVDPQTESTTLLFNPRENRWEDHFARVEKQRCAFGLRVNCSNLVAFEQVAPSATQRQIRFVVSSAK